MTRATPIALAILMAATLLPTAYAGAPSRLEQRFLQADADADGRIDRAAAEKYLPRVATHFERIDTDSDGYVTLENIADMLKSSGR